MMSLEASKYSVESWSVTSIEEKQKEKGQEGDAVACEMHRADYIRLHRTVRLPQL